MRKIILLSLWLALAGCQCDVQTNRSERILNGTKVAVKVEEINRGKWCLKNITKCMEDDEEYKNAVDRLSTFLFSSLPPFDLSRVDGVSEECRKQSGLYVEDLRSFKLWALKMFDSTAKFPSGILNGNVNQFGDFDMCLSVKEDTISGQYCLASVEVQTPQSPYLAGLHQLIHSHHHFRSRLEDPGHRVPRFSSVNWALCVPSACTSRDVEAGLRDVLEEVFDDTGIHLRYEVQASMCQRRSEFELPVSTYLAICGFVLILFWELLATAYDYFVVGEKSSFVTSFSLKKNFESMISMKRSMDDIEAVHGIRCFNAVLLLISHKSMALFFLPYANRTEMVEYVARPFSVLARAASLYTDPFLMMSGMLTAYSLLGRLDRTKKLEVLREYVSRMFRILPPFLALIVFCTFILPWLGSGPLWNLVVTHHSDICKKNWWRNMLFIHNYFGFADMCLTHTHHIGIDMQLFFASPFLIFAIWKWPRNGSIGLAALALLSTVCTYYVTYHMRLSNYVHFGTSVTQLFDTADKMYILPLHRATVYIMGIFLGYILRNYNNIRITMKQRNLGHAVALLTFSISILGPAFMGDIDYVYNPSDAALYAAVAPILWCFSFAWVIFTSKLGHQGIVEKIFTNRVFTLWTKISYTVYLTQFPIFFYNVGVARSTSDYGFFRMLFNFKEYFWIIGLSGLLTLTIELPFQNLRNVFGGTKTVLQNTKSDAVKEKLN